MPRMILLWYFHIILASVFLMSQIFITRGEIPLRFARQNKHFYRNWGYRDEQMNIIPKDWHKHHKKCLGQQQSPIDINLYSTEYDSDLERIVIKSLESPDNRELWNITNNGHTGKLFFDNFNLRQSDPRIFFYTSFKQEYFLLNDL